MWQYSSGAPYNITTGNDDNRDLAITDRPAGVGYNSARGDTNTQLDLRTSKKFRIHEKAQVEVLWEMYNVFNTVNFLQYTGNMIVAVWQTIRGTRSFPGPDRSEVYFR